jgi:hypothetical protein
MTIPHQTLATSWTQSVPTMLHNAGNSVAIGQRSAPTNWNTWKRRSKEHTTLMFTPGKSLPVKPDLLKRESRFLNHLCPFYSVEQYTDV